MKRSDFDAGTTLMISFMTLFILSFFISSYTCVPRPPRQPSWGPGGNDYPHTEVTTHTYGSEPEQFTIMEPAEPEPESAPVIAFYHGWGATWPENYSLFLEHLARKGFIVIYPGYQTQKIFPPLRAREYALNGVRDALDELQSGGHVAPDLDQFGVCGHSFGGGLAAATGTAYEEYGLPRPKVIVAIEPGATLFCLPGGSYLWGDLSLLHPETLLVVMIGEDDHYVCQTIPREIYYDSTEVLEKEYLVVRTDEYGDPDLVADHFAPATIYGTDALDYFGFWKIVTAAMTCGFDGVDCDYAKGGGLMQTYMGLWSDLTPVVPMLRLTEP